MLNESGKRLKQADPCSHTSMHIGAGWGLLDLKTLTQGLCISMELLGDALPLGHGLLLGRQGTGSAPVLYGPRRPLTLQTEPSPRGGNVTKACSPSVSV